jgi:hypothetical protein
LGLGDATNVEVLRVEWPSGLVQEFPNLSVRQTLTLTEPARLSASQTGGFVTVSLKGGRGFSYLIQASTNLVSWTDDSSVTITNLSGTARIDHPLDPMSPLKFYRAVSR